MKLLGDGLKSRDINNHHIADKLPIGQHDEPPKAVGGIKGDIDAKRREHAVDDELPNIAEYDTADEIGHKKHGAKEIRTALAPRQKKGKHKSDEVDGESADEGKLGGEKEGVQESTAARKRGHIIFEPDEACVSYRRKLGKGKIQPHQKGDEEGNDKRRKRRKHKDGKIAKEPFFHIMRGRTVPPPSNDG